MLVVMYKKTQKLPIDCCSQQTKLHRPQDVVGIQVVKRNLLNRNSHGLEMSSCDKLTELRTSIGLCLFCHSIKQSNNVCRRIQLTMFYT